jgi:hypothetical protein
MTITLARLTNISDTIVGVSDKIVFNSDKNTRNANAYITNIEITDSTAIGDNQAPKQDTGDQQHLGKIEDLYVLSGFISNRVSDSVFINTFKTWDDSPKTNTNWKNGRFGLLMDDFSTYNVIPVNTGTGQLGLMWLDLTWKINWARHPLHAPFELRLRISRSDGT